MSVNTNTNVAENVEKVKSVALEVAVPTEIVALPVSEKSDAVVLTVAAGDVQAPRPGRDGYAVFHGAGGKRGARVPGDGA